ncbi:hypothetical protein E2C01_044934 [Portunus trituberculatus]|uniref:Uncharacterized protein n=1 Tax=Portunus trituberculatus TaxID=210409 RepID=A0A5B7FZP7_PORTR|nr:hypothetical protein [Portunus trituberculatus]
MQGAGPPVNSGRAPIPPAPTSPSFPAHLPGTSTENMESRHLGKVELGIVLCTESINKKKASIKTMKQDFQYFNDSEDKSIFL